MRRSHPRKCDICWNAFNPDSLENGDDVPMIPDGLMTLRFLNRRMFPKAGTQATRFFGMDGMKPVRFSISREALEALEGNRLDSHQEIADAFDRHRIAIYALAEQVYLATPRAGTFVHEIDTAAAMQHKGRMHND